MSGAKKIAVWAGRTQRHAIMIDVFEDKEQGLFIANITASTPPLAPALRLPGQKPAMMGFEEPMKLQHNDVEMLQALTRELLKKRFGEILHFREQPQQ